MPKYGIHHIVLKEALLELYSFEDAAASDAADIIQQEMASAIIGSIGPDLFFWGPDYEPVNVLMTLYENINAVVQEYNRVVAPIRAVKEEVQDEMEGYVEDLVGERTFENILSLLRKSEEAVELFENAINTTLLAGVLSGGNVITNAVGIGSLSREFFQAFAPPLQSGANENNWYWFDMLHYRNTGSFAMNLLNGAQRPSEKAFAFGYLSHIATDVTGHPYVNQIVGAPYRLNVHRHVTVENYQDTWKYAQFYNGQSINRTLFTQLGLPNALPEGIDRMLLNAFSTTYQNVDHPTRLSGNDGFYTLDNINQTYRTLYEVLRLMEGMFVERPTEPFQGAVDIMADILGSFDQPPSAPVLDWDGDISNFNWDDIVGEVDDWVEYMGNMIGWTFSAIRNLQQMVQDLASTLAISTLLAILYGIQLLCYQAYRNARSVLSINGFVFPEPDELSGGIAHDLIFLSERSCAVNLDNFPNMNLPPSNNLVCPVSVAEQPATAAGFYQALGESTPDRFINLEPFNVNAASSYARSDSPRTTRGLHQNSQGMPLSSIGNARDFTAWMIRHANDPYMDQKVAWPILHANWNLDADRGYGYHTWRGDIPNAVPDEGDPTVENEEYE